MSDKLRTALGFDYGSKRIGVAVGQTLTATATPLKTVDHVQNQPDWKAIGQLIDEWRPDTLVVGLPLNMDGSEHAMTAAARDFADSLSRRYNLPIHMVDERLSSIEAEGIVAAAGQHRRPYSKSAKRVVDMYAAQLILQNWLRSTR